jgi:hypothetical protein
MLIVVISTTSRAVSSYAWATGALSKSKFGTEGKNMATRSPRKRPPRGWRTTDDPQIRKEANHTKGDPQIRKEADPAKWKGDPKSLKETDLTKLEGDPTEQAEVHFKRERIWLKGKMPGWLGGSSFELSSEVFPDSPLGTAMTALFLMGVGCLLAGVAYAIGVPGIVALIVGLCAPIGTFALVRALFGRWTR